jgi:hypothetical protein
MHNSKFSYKANSYIIILINVIKLLFCKVESYNLAILLLYLVGYKF